MSPQILLFILLALLVVAYASIHSSDSGQVSLTVFLSRFIRFVFTIGHEQSQDKDKQSSTQQPAKKIIGGKYKRCRYCNQPIKKTRLWKHNKICPQSPHIIRKEKQNERGNTPFD